MQSPIWTLSGTIRLKAVSEVDLRCQCELSSVHTVSRTSILVKVALPRARRWYLYLHTSSKVRLMPVVCAEVVDAKACTLEPKLSWLRWQRLFHRIIMRLGLRARPRDLVDLRVLVVCAEIVVVMTC